MLTEFASLLLSREELKEIQEALGMRAIVEDVVRHEEGLESVDRRPLFERITQLLGSKQNPIEQLEDRLDEELWRHAWYSFTDEWAWYRAQKDIEQELETLSPHEREERIHARYHEKFEDYVKEISMDGGEPGTRKSQKHPTRGA